MRTSRPRSAGLTRPSVLEAIATLPLLTTLELNAHTTLLTGSWDPHILLRLPLLTELSLILPDRAVSTLLPRIIARHTSLRKLVVLSRESPNLSDQIISELAGVLPASFTSLSLAGCNKISPSSLLPFFNSVNLESLALEALPLLAASPDFWHNATPLLQQLCTLKVTHPGPRSPILERYFISLGHLLQSSTHLTSFTIYHSGSETDPDLPGVKHWPVLPLEFVNLLAETRRLRMFQCSGIIMEDDVVRGLCAIEELREVVVHLSSTSDLVRLCLRPPMLMRV